MWGWVVLRAKGEALGRLGGSWVGVYAGLLSLSSAMYESGKSDLVGKQRLQGHLFCMRAQMEALCDPNRVSSLKSPSKMPITQQQHTPSNIQRTDILTQTNLNGFGTPLALLYLDTFRSTNLFVALKHQRGIVAFSDGTSRIN